MIFTEFLLAPTVPSPPVPQSLQEISPSLGRRISLQGREVKVTSSTMPMVKPFLGWACSRLS